MNLQQIRGEPKVTSSRRRRRERQIKPLVKTSTGSGAGIVLFYVLTLMRMEAGSHTAEESQSEPTGISSTGRGPESSPR